MESAMSEGAEPVEKIVEPYEYGTAGAPAARPSGARARTLASGKDGAPGRARSEAATLVLATMLAVTLGIVCGVWISARLASAVSKTTPAHAGLLPDAHAAVHAPKAAAEPGALVEIETSTAADEAEPPTGKGEQPQPEAPLTKPLGTKDESREAQRAGGADAVKGVGEASAQASTTVRHGAAPGVEAKAAATATATPGRGAGRGSPCPLYTSADSLTVRIGGAATLVLGGPGQQGRITAATPDWSDIAVFSEGPAAGNNGWMKFTVRSVSKRAGVYRVSFKTPCGSQTIPVTVARP